MSRQRLRIAHSVPLSILGGDFNIASTSTLYPHIIDHGAWQEPVRVH
ncbi:hypothetical protein JOF56_008186 [Kibdelosporangium banguiense]|uniref:Uncharacterized protein n=1 Tax=Kibdelosporangium banguiense TaxID=1365924 RepID=A0ABS4TTS0_9PSEU|nr:hypothetical protein [Kibdelosporangium banguiense]MBP2327801.1 hypothetical protein [Kibdelosporangium banguiense]